jgi:hypothetical protein
LIKVLSRCWGEQHSGAPSTARACRRGLPEPLFEDDFTTGEAVAWFKLTAYRDARGRFQPAYDLMRPAANYVISSYTGAKAAAYKVALFQQGLPNGNDGSIGSPNGAIRSPKLRGIWRAMC